MAEITVDLKNCVDCLSFKVDKTGTFARCVIEQKFGHYKMELPPGKKNGYPRRLYYRGKLMKSLQACIHFDDMGG